jgi:uncharacterized RDD family membrane protein YckC
MEKYQTAMRRFWAGFVDGLIFMPLGWLDSWVLGAQRPTSLLIAWLLFSYPSYWLYSVLMHGCYGQTLGKKALGVIVLDVSEVPISIRQAFLRDSIYIAINTMALIISIYFVLSGRPIYTESFSMADAILGIAALLWFIAEILTCLTNQRRRAIHDFIARTIVVKTEYVPIEITARSNNSFNRSAS